MTETCAVLDWDSEFFGLKVARLTTSTPEPEELDRARAWALDAGVDCLYWLADPAHTLAIDRAQALGFRLVDVRVSLKRSLKADVPAMPGGVGLHAEIDIDALVAIARASHEDARFFADPNFDRERCRDLYAAWIKNSCDSWADAVLVARASGRVLGYLSCHDNGDASGQVGLVAVGAEARGRGTGRALVDGSLRWFLDRGLEEARVVTQGRNAGAMRLYERSGFTTDQVQFWFHLWPSRSGATS